MQDIIIMKLGLQTIFIVYYDWTIQYWNNNYSFCPGGFVFIFPPETTQRVLSVYSDHTEATDDDFTVESGFSTYIAAFGADLQKQLQVRSVSFIVQKGLL